MIRGGLYHCHLSRLNGIDGERTAAEEKMTRPTDQQLKTEPHPQRSTDESSAETSLPSRLRLGRPLKRKRHLKPRT